METICGDVIIGKNKSRGTKGDPKNDEQEGNTSYLKRDGLSPFG